MNSENKSDSASFAEKAAALLPNINELALWKLALIALLLPPVGTFMLGVRRDIPLWVKLLSVAYTLLVVLLLLIGRSSCASSPVVSAGDWQGAFDAHYAAITPFISASLS